MNIEWDAEEYAEGFSFVPSYGEDLLRYVTWREGLRALDLGCGTGALTARLAERGADVVGLDASPDMLAVARSAHPELRFVEADATSFSPDDVGGPKDLVFSNAVLHWVDKGRHPQLISCVRDVLVPGGQFVFECGGRGNNALVHAALRHAFERRGLTYRMPMWFPGTEEYSALLDDFGIQTDEAYCISRPTPLEGADGLERWIRMFQRAQLEAAGKEADAVVREAVDELRPHLWEGDHWYVDYVRLRVSAFKR